jgi:hypoxanthine-DNA glycosylase
VRGAPRRTRRRPAPVSSFAPIAAADCEILILGSMPGTASLAAIQYYAHPRNAFWPILGDIVGFAADAAYEERLRALLAARIAVWDVLRSCRRPGSLDSNIDAASEIANDFPRFFREHPRLIRVLTNGGGATVCYRRHVLAAGHGKDLLHLVLPSTSPANASWTFARKLEAWRAALLLRSA